MLLIFVSSTNYIQIVRRQCCLFFSFLPENASQWVFFADQGHCSHLRRLAILGKVALSSFLSPCHVSALPLFSEGRPCFFFINCHTFVLFLYLSLSVCGSSFLMIHFPPVPWSEGQAVELICSSAKSSHTWPPRAQGQGGGLPTAQPPLDLKRGLFRNPPKSFVDILQSPEQAWKAMPINK